MNISRKTNTQRKKIKKYGWKLKNLFISKDLKEFINKLNKIWKIFDELPQFLKNFYNKKIIKDIHKMTHYLFDKNIKRTNNQIENKFSTTQQKSTKKLFKTMPRILAYLKPIITNQNKKCHDKFINDIIKKVIMKSIKSIISSIQEASI
ncbi:hypothetical protein MBCUR_12320 [Methanobrevibacter curvatus]|uniref:Transposase IS204/IS1001/IS1096/IS1165 DDE domain-containing protein n=2 Tax=Methanobrevibacter curvatus TaxID=49547 RepID=A0A166C7N0_9EURY|nr:hypothetical protein MBCUR_12320 [Methanobrevibacter curvatus]